MIERLLSRKWSVTKLIPLLILTIIPGIAYAQDASVAWFTDASVANSTKGAKPVDALPDAPGSVGNGVQLTKAVGIDNPVMQQTHGMLSFWLKPGWNGNDGQLHKILRVGDPTTNGFIIEKSATGYLRYVMSAGGKTTASRYSVTNWNAGEWHHIAVAWIDANSKAIGLPLWIDKVCVDGPIWGGVGYLTISTMTDKKIYIGDETSNAVMDELIVRKNVDPAVDTVYRDDFLTAPYTAIKINPDANFVPANRRVVLDCQKQFGLDAMINGKYEHVTDFAMRYGNWGDFDAKPYITWSTSNTAIATVDSNGMVTGKAIGNCTLTATFHGYTNTYNIEVISSDKPDLDLKYVERLPRYSFNSSKKWPSEGENVQSVAHIENFGYADAPAGVVVKFELIPDANDNFIDDDTPTEVRYFTIDQAIAPREQVNVTFNWPWTQNKVFVRITVDPDNAVDEISEANNLNSGLNVGRAHRWGINTGQMESYYTDKQINGVGSFSDYDWKNAHTDRVNLMLRETILPTTSPVGVRDAVRVDNFIVVNTTANLDYQEYGLVAEYYDGGFPVTEPEQGRMDVDAAICHELGHTILGLPDLYGYGFWTRNMLLKDDKNVAYAATKAFPIITSLETSMAMCSQAEGVTQCGVGYATLMNACHLWLEPHSAGLIQHFAQDRGHPFWGIHGYLVPQNGNVLHVYDVNDQPLQGAAVYVYPLTETPGGNNISSVFMDRAKFIGNTDSTGAYSIPQVTDQDWDDPFTDQMDGSTDAWNPFHCAGYDVAWTPYCYGSNGMLLIKIVSGTQVEFRMMALTELNEAYFRGETSIGNYYIKTSLTSAPGGTPIVRKVIPDVIKTTNLRPVAAAPKFIFATKGQSFSIDGSQSSDPEGQPLSYRWRGTGTWDGIASVSSGMTATLPDGVDEYTYCLWVIDGTRVSYGMNVKVTCAPYNIRGQVRYPDGRFAIGAMVGLKDNSCAGADALIYATTDSHGNYSMNVPSGSFSLCAWKPGYLPTLDEWVYVSNASINKDLTLPSPVGQNMALNQWTWASNSGVTTPPSLANDGSTSTGWATPTGLTVKDQTFIVDISKNGQSRKVGAIVIYWYGSVRPSGYYIDALINGDPKDPASWNNQNNYYGTYVATSTTGGWRESVTGCYVEALRLYDSPIKALRVRYTGWYGTAQYGIKEIQVHSKTSIDALSELKTKSAGTLFTAAGKIVTTTDGGGIPPKVWYIEDTDRSYGIRMDTTLATSTQLAGAQDSVDITGTVQIDAVTGERYVAASKVDKVYTNVYAAISALGMTNKAASSAMARGLFVKLWGNVDSVGTDNFVINDGSGSPTTVYCGDLEKPNPGAKVRVRGVVSADGTKNILLIQNQFDWFPLSFDYQPIAIQGYMGTPKSFLYIGAFSSSDVATALDTDYISAATNGVMTESNIRPSQGDKVGSLTWMKNESGYDYWDFNSIFGYPVSSTGYAHVYIYSPIVQNIDIPIGATDGVVIYVNGTKVYRNPGINSTAPGEVCVTGIHLQEGLNSVLFKIAHRYYSWSVFPQFATPGTYTNPGNNNSIPMKGLGYVLNRYLPED